MVDGQGQAGLVVSAEERGFDTKAGSNSCKSETTLNSASPSPLCPKCKSQKVWRDGIRYILGGEVQRWLCRDCGLRFSTSSNQSRAIETIETLQTKELKSKGVKDRVRQICAKGAKNLTSATELKTVAGDLEKLPLDAKGLLTKFMAYLE